ncbi:PxKF domain-containing protein [Microbacterium sp. NEAU-LLC]|uniref:PxKF domain-containing protein n=1 Tax=Microbacterium helvum TaxID=2773713 RepID=A0ABR8NQH0_9MICO|nr:PxKF domain-containing protein [Microbacterium helvum]MBD3942238.1 PxKF domain-containing protein [Microbacterium helvum]
MKRRWAAGLAAVAAAVVLAAGAATPASADDDVWVRGPASAYVAFDSGAATVGIPADEVEHVTFYGARCWTPWEELGDWVGGGVVVTTDYADTDAVSCTVEAIVDYCYWEVFFHRCDGVRFIELHATGGPFHVDSVSPTAYAAHPVGTYANASGWYRSPGSIQWVGSDSISGIAECTTTGLGGPDTAGRTVFGGCTDLAGNRSGSFAFAYKYDATPPVLAPSVASPLALGATAAADPGATDATSGVATSSCNGGAPLDTSAAGTHTVACTATDVAGNTATAPATYLVGYGFSGFGDPVRADEVNQVKAGRAVPLTFHVTSDAAGTPAADLDAAKVTVRATSLSCDLGDTPNLITETATGASGLQNLGGGDYRFVWSSPKSYAGSCKLLTVDLGDGIAHTAQFAFTR